RLLLTHPTSLRPLLPPSFYSSCYRHHRPLHSFPTRRSSDLAPATDIALRGALLEPRRLPTRHDLRQAVTDAIPKRRRTLLEERADRKSTRLNSSHRTISYAVFCLKKKT